MFKGYLGGLGVVSCLMYLSLVCPLTNPHLNTTTLALSLPACVISVRVLSGPTDPGVVRGSFVLVGGDPGIGKSTLMLQVCEGVGV